MRAKVLDQSTRNATESKHGDQGEIRIKYTDMAKALPSENVVPLYRNPGSAGKEQIEIKVNFAMAYGMTQNFSQPIYSGVIVFRCTFYGKQNTAVSAFDLRLFMQVILIMIDYLFRPIIITTTQTQRLKKGMSIYCFSKTIALLTSRLRMRKMIKSCKIYRQLSKKR